MTWQIVMKSSECKYHINGKCLNVDNDTLEMDGPNIGERGICRKDYCPIKLHDGGFVSDDFEFDVPF